MKTKIQVTFKNGASEEPAEIRIYQQIGKDPWSEEGFDAEDFAQALSGIPKNRALHIRVNSAGGDVWQGMAIKSLLDQWPAKKTCSIDGVAASTASWIPLGCDEIRMAEHGEMFIHDAWGVCGGNADDMRSMADRLEKTSNIIANIYANKCGKSQAEMRDLMKKGTLLSGKDCKDMGLVDSLTSEKSVSNFTPEAVASMRNHLKELTERVTNSAQKGAVTQNNTMKNKILAQLKEAGVAVQDSWTDEQLLTALQNLLNEKKSEPKNGTKPDDKPGNVVDLKPLQDQIDRLTEANNTAKRLRIEGEIQNLIDNDQLPAAQKEKAVKRAMSDETYLDELKAMPSSRPGTDPLRANPVELTGESVNDVQKYILNIGPKFMQNFIGKNADPDRLVGKEALLQMRDNAVAIANAYNKHRDKILPMLNTNTLDSDLKRITILQEMLRAFKVPLLPLRSFATVFENVPLEGSNKVAVPYFPLQESNDSTSYSSTTGYVETGDTTESVREVTVGGDSDAIDSGSSATAGTAANRLYQDMNFTSYELRRLPYLNLEQLFLMKAEKLAKDVFKEIVSRVIVAGNYGAAAINWALPNFDSAALAHLWLTADEANWPEEGRSLAIDSKGWQALISDPAFKAVYASGTDETLRRAQIKEAYGFSNLNKLPNLASYMGEGGAGWINHQSAMLVATAPIAPTPDVRALLTRFDIVTDPQTGISFCYRRWGSQTYDKTLEIVECTFGAAKGVDSALKRIVPGA